jgi:hypothetical protein
VEFRGREKRCRIHGWKDNKRIQKTEKMELFSKQRV